MASAALEPLHMQDVHENVQILPTNSSRKMDDEALYVDLGHDEDPSINYAQYISEGNGLQSKAVMLDDGRISLAFDLLNKGLADQVPPELQEDVVEFAVDTEWRDYPVMSIVIMIVGSRGDVQPYVALGQQLAKDGHRVRIASHETFRTFVTDANLEFFNIGGNPQDLMSYMVKNPGLMPGFESLTNGDINRKRKMLKEMIDGCWLSCHSPCPVTGRPFVADAIISNPPSFAHIHCAEALGIPLLLSFTMPWSPTTSFSHPLVNITKSNVDCSVSNHLSYTVAELLTWQGVGDLINNFRAKTLGLAPLTLRSGPMLVDRLKVPWTYCMSPALVPKPSDWKNNIDVVGFYFLDLATNYTPPAELAAFLAAGDPPVYIGFGSVVVDDPAAMSQIIFEATEKAGVRALVSAGWGGLGGVSVPSHIYILGNVPHDWLFDKERVSAVVHHGGAGTTAIGLAKGRPTLVVPFFGDQGFWGSMIHKAGAGPEPIPHKELNVENLTEGIKFAVSAPAKEAARQLSQKIYAENGVRQGVDSFYRHLPLLNMRCDLDPTRLAVWWSQTHCLKLSTFAAQTLSDEKLINMRDLILHRPKEYMSKSKCPSSTLFWNLTCPRTTSKHMLQYAALHGVDMLMPSKQNGQQKTPYGQYSVASAIAAMHEGFSPENIFPSDVKKDGVPVVAEFEPSNGTEKSSYSTTNSTKQPREIGRRKETLALAINERKNTIIESAKRSGLGLVTLPVHSKWKSIQTKSAKSQERRQRLTRIAQGREAVVSSTSAQRDNIIKRFEEEVLQTSARQELYRDAVEVAVTNGMDVDVMEADRASQTSQEGTNVTSTTYATSPASSSIQSGFTTTTASRRSTATADTSMASTPRVPLSRQSGLTPAMTTPSDALDDEDAKFVRDMEEALKISSQAEPEDTTPRGDQEDEDTRFVRELEEATKKSLAEQESSKR